VLPRSPASLVRRFKHRKITDFLDGAGIRTLSVLLVGSDFSNSACPDEKNVIDS